MITEELRKAIADYFDAGDFAEFIGVSTEEIIEAFPDKVEEVMDEILELMGIDAEVEDDYSEER